MKMDWTQNPKHLEWLERTLDISFNRDDVTWLASVGERGEVLAVVAYNRFSKENCEMTVASTSPRFLTKHILNQFFAYPFYQLNLVRVTSVVETDNLRSLQFCEKVGFKVEGRLRKWFGKNDGIVLGLLKEECRWIPH